MPHAPRTVDGVIRRMRRIDRDLPDGDGVKVFNAMYLTVTERIEAILSDPTRSPVTFADPAAMADLDVRFANLWLAAYDAAERGDAVPTAWRPLFEARHGGRWPIQYALAGMNTHIEHDLPVAVVATCVARGLPPDALHADYETVNAVLAQVEGPIRRSFLTSIGQGVDDHVGPVVHLVSGWNIDKARDLAWVTAQAMWRLRDSERWGDRFAEAVADTVGMTTRALLVPTRP